MSKRGKKIVTWLFEENGVELEIPVAMQGGKGKHDKTEFSVSISELEIEERDADINALKARVWPLVKERLVITWQPFLVVTTKAHESDLEVFAMDAGDTPRLSYSLGFNVRSVHVAEKPDGSKMHKEMEYYRPKAKEGLPALGLDEDGDVSAMIPDTPENRQALVEVGNALHQLHRRLGLLLQPESVQATLKAVLEHKAIAGLPAPSTPRE